MSEFMQSNPVSLDVSRSKFSLSHKNTLTFQPGVLVPILAYCDILPGDTWSLGASFVCRTTTPVAPVMDDAEIQVEFYFVPNDLVLSRQYMSPSVNDSVHSWKAVIGAQDSLLNMPLPGSAEMPSLAYFVPNTAEISTYYLKSPMHYLGYPVLTSAESGSLSPRYMNPFPMLAFYSVWNENYRDPNLDTPVTYSINAQGTLEFTSNADAGIVSGVTSFKNTLPHVCRYHGYFGSALPWPQRNGSSVLLPLGNDAPLFMAAGTYELGGPGDAITFGLETGDLAAGSALRLGIYNDSPEAAPYGYAMAGENFSTTGATLLTKTNLKADLSQATAASINTIRYAFQLQKWYEAMARGGNRIQDMTRVFGVIPANFADGRPQYLGGKRIPLQQTQVENTTGVNTGTDRLGTVGAYSLTSDTNHYFTKSFDTWGTIIGVCCVRVHDSFANPFPKMLKRKSRFDYYWPQFANLGEQPVYKSEIDPRFGADDASNVFGYQEYAAEYRMLSDTVHGEVNPAFGSVKYWTYGNDLYTQFSGSMNLKQFLDASYQSANFDQTLQVSGSTAGYTFLAQFYFDIKAVRPLPMYSIPGLVDHH